MTGFEIQTRELWSPHPFPLSLEYLLTRQSMTWDM